MDTSYTGCYCGPLSILRYNIVAIVARTGAIQQLQYSTAIAATTAYDLRLLLTVILYKSLYVARLLLHYDEDDDIYYSYEMVVPPTKEALRSFEPTVRFARLATALLWEFAWCLVWLSSSSPLV